MTDKDADYLLLHELVNLDGIRRGYADLKAWQQLEVTLAFTLCSPLNVLNLTQRSLAKHMQTRCSAWLGQLNVQGYFSPLEQELRVLHDLTLAHDKYRRKLTYQRYGELLDKAVERVRVRSERLGVHEL